MASIESVKLSVEEFYERRAEVQEIVFNGIITQDIMDGAMETIPRKSNLLDIVDIPLNQLQHTDSSERTIPLMIQAHMLHFWRRKNPHHLP